MSSKIKDGLFMGDVDAAQDAEFLQLNGITHVINCVPREVPNVFQQSLGLTYTAVDLGETLQRPFFDLQSREFMGLIQAIDRSLERTDSVLVHSMDGLCRSPGVMVGYLMVKYCWGLDKAHEFVAMKRADIKLHESYVQQLAALEGQIQKSFSARATEQQLYDWTLRAGDPKADEAVLVHTFLNSSAAVSDPKGDTPRHLPLKMVPSQRRISWIDQSSELRNLHPVLATRPERPPNCSYNAMRPANGWIDLLDPPPTLSTTTQGDSSRRLQHGSAVRQAFADLSLIDQQSRVGVSTAPADRLVGVVDVSDKPNAPPVKRNMRALSFSAPKSSAVESDPSASPVDGDGDHEDAELLPSAGRPGPRSSKPRYLRDTQSSMSSRPRRSLRTGSNVYQRSDVGITAASGLVGAAATAGVAYGFAGPVATTKATARASKAPMKRAPSRTSHLPPKPASSSTVYTSGGTADSGRVFLDVDFSTTSTSKATASKSGSLSARSTRRALSDHPLYERSMTAAPARPRTAPARTRKELDDPALRKRSDPGYAGLAPAHEPSVAPLHRLYSSFDYGAPSVTTTATAPSRSQRRAAPAAAAATFTRIRSTGRVSWK